MKILKYIGFAFLALIILMIAVDFLPGSNFQEAQKSYKNKNYEEALKLVNEAIKNDTSDALSYELRGKILYELHDTIHSKEDLKHSLALIESKDSYTSHAVRKDLIGWDLTHGNKAEAESLLKKELESLGNDDSLGRANVLNYIVSEMQGMNDTLALCKLLENTTKELECIECERALGFIYGSIKKNKAALKYLKKYLKVYPNDIDVIKAKEMGSKEGCYNLREITAKTEYYEQYKCCDGSISKTTGRGACSHKGGVCKKEMIPFKNYTMDCK